MSERRSSEPSAVDSAAPVSIVVATRNRGDQLVPLIESLQRSRRSDFELLIVDQSSDDRTAVAVKAFQNDPRIRYMWSSQPGLSKARNVGVRSARHDLIAITDDDCTVPPEWLDRIIEPMETDPRVGITFCTVLPEAPEGEPGVTPHVIIPARRTLTRPRHAWMRSWRKPFWLGAGMAVRRQAFDELGGFDDLLGAGARFGAAEDNDFAWRCLRIGWRVHETPDATVNHFGFRNLEETRALVVRDHFGVGGAYAKHLKAGRLGVLHGIGSWIVKFAVLGPSRDVLSGRRPRGFRGPYMMVRGLFAGLATPIERARLRYRVD